ncbi:hypothetical protein ACIQOW_06225 [Kitasatospora sp. NPDC091335]|uniref:hypothetical protein n=1 Tax=Kitasatospora sp. NPDC091335 TaxID=3364085 RepID=UPI0038018921
MSVEKRFVRYRESVKAVSEYLGHADPGLTLRVYAHLMPESRHRARKAMEGVFGVQDHEG